MSKITVIMFSINTYKKLILYLLNCACILKRNIYIYKKKIKHLKIKLYGIT